MHHLAIGDQAEERCTADDVAEEHGHDESAEDEVPTGSAIQREKEGLDAAGDDMHEACRRDDISRNADDVELGRI